VPSSTGVVLEVYRIAHFKADNLTSRLFHHPHAPHPQCSLTLSLLDDAAAAAAAECEAESTFPSSFACDPVNLCFEACQSFPPTAACCGGHHHHLPSSFIYQTTSLGLVSCVHCHTSREPLSMFLSYAPSKDSQQGQTHPSTTLPLSRTSLHHQLPSK
jgi:hypothetical protein